MKLLLLHNRYQWPGGEDAVVEAEAALLRAHGHEVVEHVADNRDFLSKGKLAVALALRRGAWSQPGYDLARRLVAESKPDLVHVHNFWYALSPAVLAGCHETGVPVVVTLHNFRLVCPGGVLLDGSGAPCDRCVGRSPWLGAWRRCYHGSLVASAAVARMIAVNRRRGTWRKDVDLFIVPSEFCKGVFGRGGLPAERIVVKPNFVDDAETRGRGDAETGGAERQRVDTSSLPRVSASPRLRVVFVGRLSREKGLRTLLAAWPEVEKAAGAELHIVGEGPLAQEMKDCSKGQKVFFPGRLGREELFREIAGAALVVLPSECYETFGRAVVEAYACGRPAVVSRIGGPAELVRDGETGLLFKPGDAGDLAAKLLTLLQDGDLRARMGQAARAEYLARYTPERNYEQLLNCYQRAMETHNSCQTGRAE